jgi:CheY-like chemotaxis protein
MAEDPICLVCSQPIVPGGAVAFRRDGVVHVACLPAAITGPTAEPVLDRKQAAELAGTVPRPIRSRVLIIDDEPHVRTFVGDALDSLGYEVDEAEDGVRGLALLDRHRYALLVTDVRMPQMSGWEVVETVSRRQSIPIVIMSGFITSADEERAHEAGMAILYKPFGVEALRCAIRDVMPTQPADLSRKPLAKSGDLAETDIQEGGRASS